MKIALVYDFLSEFGGIERVMKTQAEYLRPEHELTLYFAYVEKDIKEHPFFQGKDIQEYSWWLWHRLSSKVMWSFLNPLPFAHKKFDFAISHSFIGSWNCLKNKWVRKTPYAAFLHHPPQFLYFPNKETKIAYADSMKRKIAAWCGTVAGTPLRWLDKLVVKKADLVFANSEFTKRNIERIYERKDVIISYPPVRDIFKIINKKKAQEVRIKYSLQKPYVYAHSRIIPDKHFDWILEAMQYVNKKYDLVISGSGEERYSESLKTYAKKIGLDTRVHFLGKISDEDLVALHNEAEVFVLAAPKEEFGIVSVEAMACGTPCVAWNDQAGPQELIGEGKTGFLAKPYDKKDLAEKIEQVISKNLKKERKKIAESVEKFSEENQKKIFIRALQKITLSHHPLQE